MHFVLFLKFCNEKRSHIISLPISSTLFYLINFTYYKTLLEYTNIEKNNNYKELICLLDRKQQLINSKEK